MNIWILLPAVLLSASRGNYSAERSQIPQPVVGDAVQELTLDIKGEMSTNGGRVPLGSTTTCSIAASNSTEWASQIRFVSSTCPCVMVTIEKANLKAGETGNISIAVATAPLSGIQNHVAEFEATFLGTDGTIKGTCRFRLGVSYQADLAMIVEPQGIWATVVAGESVYRSIYSRSSTLDALRVRVERSSLPFVLAKDRRRLPVPSPARENEEVVIDRIEIAGQTPGVYSGEIVMKTDDPDLRDYLIPVHVRVVDRWIASPAGFAFLYDATPDPLERSVSITGRSDQQIEVSDIRVIDDKQMKVEATLLSATFKKSDTATIVTLRLDAKSAPAEGLGTVELLGKDGTVLSRLPYAWIRRLPK